MIDRIDEKLKTLINNILDKNPILLTYEDYSILQDYRARKLAEEAEERRQASWKKDQNMLFTLLSALGKDGGDNDVH